jgi:hypothetical protein
MSEWKVKYPVVEAERFDPTECKPLPDGVVFDHQGWYVINPAVDDGVYKYRISPGDWIIRDPEGNIIECGPDDYVIFPNYYLPVDQDDVPLVFCIDDLERDLREIGKNEFTLKIFERINKKACFDKLIGRRIVVGPDIMLIIAVRELQAWPDEIDHVFTLTK